MLQSSGEIKYEVVRSRRNTADVVIERDGRLLVRAPETVSRERIEQIVEAKKYWIYKNLAEWRDLNATRVLREYRNGEGFLYLGRSFRLLLVANQTEPLQLRNGRFCLCRDLAEHGSMRAAREAFKNFYIARGRERMLDRVCYYAPKVGALVSKVEVRELGNRWASYSPRGNVAFHWKCLMAPPTIIDYIVVHELCHFHHLDHTSAFWNEVDKVIPAYHERKEWLKRNGAGFDV
jgi:predicted metal-dependent hydrolase